MRRPQDARGVRCFLLARGRGLALFPLYGSVAGSSLLVSWFFIPAVLALFGAWWPGHRYSGVGLILFGTYPALFVTGGFPRPPGEEVVRCGGVSVELVLLGLGLWTVALLGRGR